MKITATLIPQKSKNAKNALVTAPLLALKLAQHHKPKISSTINLNKARAKKMKRVKGIE